jgi:hypothetical protein
MAEDPSLEREKWLLERQWRENEERRKDREELRKDHEARWAFWKNPILLSFIGAFIAVVTNIVADSINAQDKLRSEEDKLQAGLLQEALKAADTSAALAKLQLLNDAKLVPRYSVQIVDLMQNERYAGTFARATGTKLETTVSVSLPRPTTDCVAAASAVTRETGWIYLGRTTADDKSAWDTTNSTFDSLRYDQAKFHSSGTIAPGFPSQLKGECLTTKAPKYLRDQGQPGQRVQSAVRRVLPNGARLRIIEVDDTGTDIENGVTRPVVWARVEVL